MDHHRSPVDLGIPKREKGSPEYSYNKSVYGVNRDEWIMERVKSNSYPKELRLDPVLQ